MVRCDAFDGDLCVARACHDVQRLSNIQFELVLEWESGVIEGRGM